MITIYDRRDPADDFPVISGKETGGLGVQKKRIYIAQDKFHLADERRDPVGVSLIHLPGEADEFIQVAFAGYQYNFHCFSLVISFRRYDLPVTPEFTSHHTRTIHDFYGIGKYVPYSGECPQSAGLRHSMTAYTPRSRNIDASKQALQNMRVPHAFSPLRPCRCSVRPKREKAFLWRLRINSGVTRNSSRAVSRSEAITRSTPFARCGASSA